MEGIRTWRVLAPQLAMLGILASPFNTSLSASWIFGFPTWKWRMAGTLTSWGLWCFMDIMYKALHSEEIQQMLSVGYSPITFKILNLSDKFLQYMMFSIQLLEYSLSFPCFSHSNPPYARIQQYLDSGSACCWCCCCCFKDCPFPHSMPG